jgi:hypothetical protein
MSAAHDEHTTQGGGAPPPDVTIDAPPDPRVTGLWSTQATDVRADRLEASQSAIGRLVARDVRSDQGALGIVRARSVVASEGALGAVAAEHVETHGGFTLLMIARRVSGDVTVLLDWRAAAAAVGALLVLGRLLRGRR